MSVEAVEWPLAARRFGAAPGFLTFIAGSLSGREVRNPQAERRLRFNAASGIKTVGDVQTLIAWHAAMEGSLYGFLLKDWLDFQTTKDATTLYNSGGVTVQTQGKATLTSTPAIFQLEKWYSVNSRTYKRKLTRPKSGTATVYFDGTIKTSGVDYTINFTTGLLTRLTGTDAVVITHTCEFYVPVRFEQDDLPLDLLLYRPSSNTGIGEVPDVPLLEDVE